MNFTISTIWSHPFPSDTREQLQKILQQKGQNDKPLQVFFRADDIALVDESFRKLMHLFQKYEIPLCLAVVPDWLSTDCWKDMDKFMPENPLWCWHQHGRNHINHETQGKKCEFGDSRTEGEIRADLLAGREKLSRIIGDLFFPVFTPPWNRCSSTTLELLKDLRFNAVSRAKGAKPTADDIIPDLAVNVDLHTRKENDFTEGWQNLMGEFQLAAESRRMGIMLHHQRMNDAAFTFLDMLLFELRSDRNVSPCTFKDLLQVGR